MCTGAVGRRLEFLIQKLRNAVWYQRLVWSFRWRIAGREVWNSALIWACENIYLRSKLPDDLSDFHHGIIVFDKAKELTPPSFSCFEDTFVTTPVNKRIRLLKGYFYLKNVEKVSLDVYAIKANPGEPYRYGIPRNRVAFRVMTVE